MLDVFNNNAFSVVSLTDALQELKHRPTRLASLGLFEATPVATLDIAIERRGDELQLVRPSPRGGPGELIDMPKRTLTNMRIPHFQRDWHVYADEVQGVRAFGTERSLETVQKLVARKMAAQVRDFDVTEEHARLGAVKGTVTYADGSTLDLFAKFDAARPAPIDFDLARTNPIDGILRRRCTEVIRKTRATLGGLPFSHVHAFVGDNFFDDLIQHREVRETYKGWGEAQILRESYVGKNRGSNPIFEFGGIVFENYGAVETAGDASLLGIHTDEAQFFPIGSPSLFRSYFGPADYSETVNTLGIRIYAKQWPMGNDKGINGEVQMNALHICTRPAVLQKGLRTVGASE